MSLIGLIVLRRGTPSVGIISCVLRQDSWGRGCAIHAAGQGVSVVFTTAGPGRLEVMCHPGNPVSGRVLSEPDSPAPARPAAMARAETPSPASCMPWSRTAPSEESRRDPRPRSPSPVLSVPGTRPRPRSPAPVLLVSGLRSWAAGCGLPVPGPGLPAAPGFSARPPRLVGSGRPAFLGLCLLVPWPLPRRPGRGVLACVWWCVRWWGGGW
ncbi:GNAT family N-acetyltransferase [Streptomyces sp. NPDC059892]|uniref:GNAT family N-acetyltransferase n=1 Tax=Streptomyces sp. NPDC059892 TaxID=3346989 RepID=UPI003667290E